jgi:hypothetical protein
VSLSDDEKSPRCLKCELFLDKEPGIAGQKGSKGIAEEEVIMDRSGEMGRRFESLFPTRCSRLKDLFVRDSEKENEEVAPFVVERHLAQLSPSAACVCSNCRWMSLSELTATETVRNQPL